MGEGVRDLPREGIVLRPVGQLHRVDQASARRLTLNQFLVTLMDELVPAAGELVATPEGDLGRCECGARIIIWRGGPVCELTAAKYEALYGDQNTKP